MPEHDPVNPGQPPKETFELAPEEPPPAAAPPPRPAPLPTAAAPAAGPKPAISAPGLTEDFDEDADFDRDPEVERALGKNKSDLTPRDAGASLSDDDTFIKTGLGEPHIIALIGAGVLLSAIITAWITAPSRGWAHALLTAYSTLLHAGTGVGAIVIGSILAEKKLGKWELGAARMLLAVALFQLVFHLNLPAGVWLKPLAATAVYCAATIPLFRLPIPQWFSVAASHFVIWLVVEGLVWLNGIVYAAPKAATG